MHGSGGPRPAGWAFNIKNNDLLLTCALCAALQPMFCHLFSKTSGPFSPKLLQKSKTRKKEENVKNVLKNVEKVIQIQKKGHRLGCWGWETWLLICLGLPRAWKRIFFFTFFSDFGNLVRRNVQNIDFLEYFDDKSDVYSTNRAEILHARIFWRDLQFKPLRRPKTKKNQKKKERILKVTFRFLAFFGFWGRRQRR